MRRGPGSLVALYIPADGKMFALFSASISSTGFVGHNNI